MLQIWLLYDVYFLESAYVMSKPYSLATICVLINTHLVIMLYGLMPALVPCRKKLTKRLIRPALAVNRCTRNNVQK